VRRETRDGRREEEKRKRERGGATGRVRRMNLMICAECELLPLMDGKRRLKCSVPSS
jgi:hypothetical protein